ncbi:MAG: hypothetical protein ACKV2U_31950 [Bryobacteraceae bacterium]
MRAVLSLLFALACALPAPSAAAKTDPTEPELQRIIEKFAEKESEFLLARERYIYRQTVRVEDFDGGGTSGGRYDLVSDIEFSPGTGKRSERIVRAPVSTIKFVQFSPEDEQDIRSVQPFVLNSKELPKYHVRYLGREKLDEIDTLAFAVKPKEMVPGERYFAGIAWVDEQDLQIVKTYGRATGKLKKGNDQRFPKFETFREQIDGKYWFPVLTRADDTLYFEDSVVRLKMRVKYEDYKQFKGETKITFGDEVPATPPKPEPPKKP